MNQPAHPSKPSASPAIVVALLFSAVMLVALGTILPGMLELQEPLGLILRLVLYAAAVGDVVIALWFRARMKKARPQTAGTIQRQ